MIACTLPSPKSHIYWFLPSPPVPLPPALEQFLRPMWDTISLAIVLIWPQIKPNSQLSLCTFFKVSPARYQLSIKVLISFSPPDSLWHFKWMICGPRQSYCFSLSMFSQFWLNSICTYLFYFTVFIGESFPTQTWYSSPWYIQAKESKHFFHCIYSNTLIFIQTVTIISSPVTLLYPPIEL